MRSVSFWSAYKIGLGLTVGALTAVMWFDIWRDVRAAAHASAEAEPLVIEVRPELWTDPHYEMYRYTGGHV